MRLTISWAAVLLFFLAFHSCKTPKTATSGQNLTSTRALLWEIKVDDKTPSSYVYGTIHMIEKDDYFLPEGTLAAIDACQKMVFEIDVADMNDMSKLMGIMNKIFMSDGQSLGDLLSEEDYAVVEKHFQNMGLPMMMLDRIKPLFLTAFAYGDLDPNSMESGDIKSYELEFYEMAESRKMETAGLETIEFQISVFDSIPYKEQAMMLVETIKSSDLGNDEFKLMTDMYKKQDIQAMVAMIGDEESGYADYEDLLLKKRNENWIPQIIEMAGKSPTFFAVGAGHLGGKFGVLQLLQNEGVKVTPINPLQ